MNESGRNKEFSDTWYIEIEKSGPNQKISAESGANSSDVQAQAPKKKPVKNILFVDDEEPVRKLFKAALEKFGYSVTVASNGEEAIRLFRESPADLVITDLFMPLKDGPTLITQVMQEFPGTKVFAVTGGPAMIGDDTMIGIETELEIAQLLGAVKGFTKPVKLSQLLNAIKAL